MREDATSSSNISSRRGKTAASPANSISSPAPAQPHVAVASPTSRRDSMEPEAQTQNVTPLVTVLSPQPQSPLTQRQMQHSAKESSEKAVEKKEGKSKLHPMKRIWSSLVRK
ncbi:hypothetical protein COCC4DRAFT_193785 [Bipolaris maydis ATCC 48331]|uniref:Uncharacterized protein n=3 Tax=Cochliobolus heterostrophus TaxID=5016 RepID=M2SM87_COCH5|nr:uncharacterized protein COCC4DRAFT_193785 [Bipolaris maydis ATCC 48331]EMD86435.1 hypothetical protein COCHEDRAFT_1218641 [Bipolaris maydis C5]ENI06386.1 hypothetical protein COCC4DRAFT_193785 [Bipolaris maydis ATCC 48331]